MFAERVRAALESHPSVGRRQVGLIAPQDDALVLAADEHERLDALVLVAIACALVLLLATPRGQHVMHDRLVNERLARATLLEEAFAALHGPDHPVVQKVRTQHWQPNVTHHLAKQPQYFDAF